MDAEDNIFKVNRLWNDTTEPQYSNPIEQKFDKLINCIINNHFNFKGYKNPH